MNQSSCYSATVSHVHRVCSVLRDSIPKFTSFRGSERGNATGSQRALGKTRQKSARSSGEFIQCRPKSSEQMVHTHWFVHGQVVGTAATQLQEWIPSQAATEQVLLRGSLWRSWQQNPLLAAESMQSLFRGTRWSPSLSLHWRRSRELALTGATALELLLFSPRGHVHQHGSLHDAWNKFNSGGPWHPLTLKGHHRHE